MSHEEDVDAWAKESCHCGHARYRHTQSGTGACLATTSRVVFDGLPVPVYEPAGAENDPFSYPANWPPLADLPVVETPCGCKAFSDPEPFEPDEDMR